MELESTMDITIIRKEDNLCVSWNAVTAQVNVSEIQLGHMGCKLLGTLANIPQNLVDQWNKRFGRNWKNKKDSKLRLAKALQDALMQSRMDGAVLWDTMRTGSDYWRPGKLILDSVEMLPTEFHNRISYAREDIFCPPKDLLKEFMKDDSMSFGEYASRYSQYLNAQGTLTLAVSSVLFNLAQGKLPIFYCVDPYIPGYADRTEFCSDVPYNRRHWLDELRSEGCHRVILIEEIIKALLVHDIDVSLFELDSTFEKSHHRIVTG
jgi:hypothetical protein